MFICKKHCIQRKYIGALSIEMHLPIEDCGERVLLCLLLFPYFLYFRESCSRMDTKLKAGISNEEIHKVRFFFRGRAPAPR